MDQKTIAFHHFGCKVNFSETSSLSRKFIEKGYQVIDFKDKADIYVISTCIVTAVAEKKCRAAIRQAHKNNPEAKIAVIGCFSELKPEKIAAIEGVSLILGHQEKFTLVEQLEQLDDSPAPLIHPKPEEQKNIFLPSYSYGDRTRSFLKIQDGCDYYCAYCTIPLARGNSRSDTIANVISSAKEIFEAGVKEIILTGVNIGDFGKHNNETFFQLIRELEKLSAITRIRISSIEPDLLSDDIIDFVSQSKKFMPHFHLPLQSGCDRILNAMKRKYNTSLFTSRIRAIRHKIPLACIASDLIVGFPGETAADFRQTYEFLENTDLSYMHIFSYSERENTLASRMPYPVQDQIKKTRSRELHRLSELKKQQFYLNNRGQEVNVLFESGNTNGFMHGFSENYIKVKTVFNPSLSNQIVPVILNTLENNEYFMTNP
ncbi:MAG: tRNA (N(6)-L-threonylcarbamoyladenosine(37)-C(2))-methylthiotransferase MtaB [Bacteroidetes bacterium]|nr:tRNA (N(6)-L-threonylcarbamoyladenosine(37)-C(2))-methylthiotransferase MtaB [Bacteroidota bacterium]